MTTFKRITRPQLIEACKRVVTLAVQYKPGEHHRELGCDGLLLVPFGSDLHISGMWFVTNRLAQQAGCLTNITLRFESSNNGWGGRVFQMDRKGMRSQEIRMASLVLPCPPANLGAGRRILKHCSLRARTRPPSARAATKPPIAWPSSRSEGAYPAPRSRRGNGARTNRLAPTRACEPVALRRGSRHSARL